VDLDIALMLLQKAPFIIKSFGFPFWMEFIHTVSWIPNKKSSSTLIQIQLKLLEMECFLGKGLSGGLRVTN
jgi:hypothetical protein